MSSFADGSAILPSGPGEYGCEIPDGWQQGKGAYGGLTVALMARAMTTHVANASRPLRALSAELPSAALPGPATVRVETLREGGSICFVEARLMQEGKVLGRATGTFGAVRVQRVPRVEPISVQVPHWSDAPVLALPAGVAPPFSQWFEYRPVGPLPYSGAKEALVEGWIVERAATGGAPMDTPHVLGLLDAWYPAFLPTARMPQGSVTVGYTAQLLADVSQFSGAEPLFYRGRSVADCDGHIVEFRELYAQGVLIALNQQTIALM